MAVRKYLFISDTLSSGGAQRAVSILASGIAEKGFEVHCILYERAEQEYPISDKVRLHLLPKRNGERHKLEYYVRKLLLMRQMIHAIAPDIVIPFLPDQINHFFVATRFTNIPFIASVRNNPFLYPESRKMRMVGKAVALLSSGIFLQTNEQADFFPKFARKKTFVVPNPVGGELLACEYREREEIRKIATFGRLSPQKNQALLLQAFAAVHQVHPSITLSLYGAGDEEQALRELAKDLGIADAVTFQGRVSNVAEALMSTDLFVLSSDYEGMPNALMEAMAVGLPCISTDCPTGPKDLIEHRKDGILVERNDAERMASAILDCVENPALCRNMGKAAKQKMRNQYQVDIVVEKFIDEVNRIVEGSRHDQSRS